MLASFDSSVPSNLAERILRSRDALQDELKQVTVLFADIRDSTALIAELDPEQAFGRLEPVLKSLIEAVHLNDGVINRIQGDGIMALFGAPLALEDHALRACHAGLSMQEAVEKEAPDDIAIRVGLNSGEVLVRSIDNDLSMDYDAIGSTVHLAARMEQLADPGAIHLTENTYQLAEGFLKVTPLGMTAIRGIKSNIETFRLTGLVDAKSRWDIRAIRGLTRLVGRKKETASLHKAMFDAKSGAGQVVTVVGEPGIGKSRLVHELINSDISQGWAVLKTATAAHAKNTAYFPISRLLRSWFDIDSNDRPELVADKIQRTVSDLDPGLSRIVPALHSLLDISIEDVGWNELDAFQRRRQIIDAICAIVLAQARISPVVVVFEDLHWLDTESQAVIKSLAECASDARLLILATYRPEQHDEWISSSNVVRIPVEPLGSKSSNRLLTSLIGTNFELEPLKRQLIARAGGTPLFLEEMVRTLIETGAIEGDGQNKRLAQQLKEITIPATVQSVIAARIDRLVPSQKSLLQLAAVVGNEFSAPILLAISDLDDNDLMPALAELQELGFLYQPQGEHFDEYSFKHELTREVAYESILTERRRQLHAQLVETMESLFVDRLDEHVDRLADHALRGALWDKAVRYHLQACMRATLRSANREAIVLLEGGVRALARLPAGVKREKAAVDLRLIANTAFISLGELERLIQNLLEAEAFATGINDRRRLASVNTWLSIGQWLRGDHQRALEAGEVALSIADEINHPDLQFAARINIGMAYHGIGDFDKVIQYHDAMHQLLAGDLRLNRTGWAPYPIVLVNTFLASSHIEIGQFDSAKPLIDEACRFADEVNHPYSQAMIRDYHGYYLLSRGEVSEAITVFEDSLVVCHEYEILNLYRSIAAKLGMAYARSGRAEDAISMLEPVTKPEDFLKGGTYVWLWLYVGLGEAYLAADRLEEALQQVSKGVDLTRSTKETPHLAYATKLLGDVHAKQGGGHAQLAEKDYRDAMACAESCRMTPMVAHCHRALGELYDGTDRPSEARPEFLAARQYYDELGLTIFREDVDAHIKH
jgi:class 3 adenylate cyclase/tetratricopeptide (TPR) repeat protein